MGRLSHVIFEMILRARDRQKYGKSAFTEAGFFAERIRLARDLLGRATDFNRLSGVKQLFLRKTAERVLIYVARDSANLGKLERALNHARPDPDALTHSKILDAYQKVIARKFPPTTIDVWDCFRKLNPNNKPPTKDVMRDIITNTLHLPLANAKPPGRPPGS
jgi:hypothetical protein